MGTYIYIWYIGSTKRKAPNLNNSSAGEHVDQLKRHLPKISMALRTADKGPRSTLLCEASSRWRSQEACTIGTVLVV